ncbi:flagellar hook-basal body complex protein FliE [Pseudomonas sp. NPDC012596]|uniref:flagellar hook-basal body complex protein FliE n=1 Tax=Pseudomonas sp. NPDC012596 TaxID=3364419 RepID=UPI003688F46D
MVQGLEVNKLLLEMRSMQSALPLATTSHLAIGAANPNSFTDLFEQALEKVHVNQQASGQLAKAFELGTTGVDLTQVMIASQKASVSTQALVQVRNKVVQAYQDIMQMPV